MKSSPLQNDADKLARIKRLAQAHATPASNIGCHQLALKILKIIDTSDEHPSKGDDHVSVPPMGTGG